MMSVTQYLAKQPWAQTEIQINGWEVAAAYVVIVTLCVYAWRVTKFSLCDSNIVG